MSLAVSIVQHDEHDHPVWYLQYSYARALPGAPARGPYHSRSEAEEALHHLRDAAHMYGEFEISVLPA
ncbi:MULTISPECIES: hypothetical protein [unclassified Frigoribacterium]|jgi:hypothetical protein|uniref:hypothetical protein n=1 Tax=unclassified Frigoribacterium TaxID=2627005 RepID=UPI0005B90D84|nr:MULTISPECIES: hypothetical protein [unclassified Frigoribacterium]KIU02281.1 hypothetical protein SZ60_13010 [Frigoribacterium sp. MEB024]KQN41695.1 hypothetical protein ASE87_12935 [Frigoribacterium sp. Leaf44]MBD8538272.1 hypothetical protein [Frigoribacterium sp. CFBP 8751]